MFTAEKLLNELRISADELRSKGDILAAELSDRQEIVTILSDVCNRKLRENNELHHRINIFEG